MNLYFPGWKLSFSFFDLGQEAPDSYMTYSSCTCYPLESLNKSLIGPESGLMTSWKETLNGM